VFCPKCYHTPLGASGTAGSGNPRYRCSACGYRTTQPLKALPEDSGPVSNVNLKAKRLVITSAQNATPIHKKFLATLRVYCEHNDAELVVLPYRYRNPTSIWSSRQENEEWWDSNIVPYLCNERKDLNQNLMLLGDLNITPTAARPLSSLDGLTGARSGIVGFPKIELKTVATPSHRLPKLMMSTGAVTRKNYTDSKAGKKGEFHHTFGALTVEIKNSKIFHVRQLVATKAGHFMDLDKSYTDKGVSDIRISGLVMGDTHVDSVCPKVHKATFGPGGILDVLRPKHLYWNDLLDWYCKNRHHEGNPFKDVAKYYSGRDDVFGEVDRACQYLSDHTPRGVTSYVVPSNHNDGAYKWLCRADWRDDPQNAEAYLELALATVRAHKNGEDYLDPFTYWAERRVKKKGIKYPRRNDPLSLHGIEVLHGDIGSNGARGSIGNLSKIGVKSFIAHSHTPGIQDGCWQVGTSTVLNLEYNNGPSSWLNTHGIIYPNGKRALLNIIDGSWRL